MYIMRITRKEGSAYSNDRVMRKHFSELAKLIYNEDVDISFAFSIATVDAKDSDLSYFDITLNYFNYLDDIESIEVYKVTDITKVSCHPAYSWSDWLFYMRMTDREDDLSQSTIEASQETFDLSAEISKEGLKEELWLSESEMRSVNIPTVYILHQAVFKSNGEGVRLKERIDVSDLSVEQIKDVVNGLSRKYKLLHIVNYACAG